MSDTVNLGATCTVCKAQFAMTDKQERVLEAYKVWDSEHKHTDTNQKEHSHG